MLPSASLPTSVKSKSSAASQPIVSREEALTVYRRLLLARLAEEAIRREYPHDEMKTPVHLGIGQEAIPIGVCHSLPRSSKLFGTYRNHALYVAATGETDAFFGELYGRATGPGKGKAGSMHIASPEHGLLATSAVVATTIPVAVGAALAESYRGGTGVVAVFFGDGAVEEGVFWESVNFASLRKLRVLFVCEDNELAIHTPTSQRQGFRSIPDAVRGFHCDVHSADGSDVHEVIATTRRALAQIADDPRPALLHFRYLRFLEHVGPREDFDVGYRRRPTSEELERRDPVRRLKKLLVDEHGASEAELAAIRTSVDEQIATSIARAQAAPFAPPEELWRDVLA